MAISKFDPITGNYWYYSKFYEIRGFTETTFLPAEVTISCSQKVIIIKIDMEYYTGG